MPSDVHLHVEIPGRAAALSGRALALDLYPLSVGDSGRYPGLDRPCAHRPAAAAADSAGVGHDQTAATARRTGLREREAPQVATGLTGALAGWTDLGNGSRLRPGATTHLARTLVGQPEGHRRAVDRVAKAERCLGFDVGAATRPRLLRRGATAEHTAKQVAKPPAGTRRAEDVAKVEGSELAARTARHPGRAGAEQRARLVILRSPLWVRKHAICFRHVLQALFVPRVALVRVRVVLAGQLAVRLLDLLSRRALGDTESLVIVLLEEVLCTQQASPDQCCAGGAFLRTLPWRRIRGATPWNDVQWLVRFIVVIAVPRGLGWLAPSVR